jgi:hypothetical protein
MSTAVLQLVHAAADAVATTSPGRADGAILAGFNVISRHLSWLEHGGESDGSQVGEEEGDEVEEAGSRWSDESDLSWAEGEGDGEGGLTPEDENLRLTRGEVCLSDGEEGVEETDGDNGVGVDGDDTAKAAVEDGQANGSKERPRQ